jgi:uncharacterized membrane protein
MGIVLLTAGLLLFVTPHLLRELQLREPLLARLGGEGPYRGLYTLIALSGLLLIVWGKSASDFTMIWQPRYELRWLSHLIMLPAVVFVVAGNLPLSHLRRALRHPMLLGVVLWGAAHLWANGDLASILLFGGLMLWAGFKALNLEAHFDGRPASLIWDAAAILIGLVLYFIIAVYHGYLFGAGLNFAE